MRGLALAQVAVARGWEVEIAGDIDAVGMALAARISPATRVTRIGLDSTQLRDAVDGGFDIVHVDTYAALPDLRRAGVFISNMQDGAHGVRGADLAIDANLGSESSFVRSELSASHLAGGDAAIVRGQVLRQRDHARPEGGVPRVLVVMGGTDPAGVTPRVIDALQQWEEPIELAVVDPAGNRAVADAAARLHHDVRILGLVDDLPALAAQHDLVITAAGTSVWDFACMGLPMALVCVVDNQVIGYHKAVEAGLAVGLGTPPHADLTKRAAVLGMLLRDRDELARQSAKLMRVIDGLGTWRTVSTWEQLIDTPLASVPTPATMRARRADSRDSRQLFEWRNDEATRRSSRSAAPLEWDAHVAWLERSLANRDRKIYLIEHSGEPVATVRWDRSTATDWEASITVAPERRGRGLSAAVLAIGEAALAAELHRPYRLLAAVHADNHASLRLFRRAGYLPHFPADRGGFAWFARWQLAPSGLPKADPT